MEITFSAELEKMVLDRVAQGAYPDASTLVREAVEALFETDAAEDELERIVALGLDSGPAAEISRADWARLRGYLHQHARKPD